MGHVGTMTPCKVVTYAGSSHGVGFSDRTPAGELEVAIRSSDIVVIDDPMSFPWEWFTHEPIICPIIVNLHACSTTDLVALQPVLAALTPSDRLLGDRSTVEDLCAAAGLENIWSDPNLEPESFAVAAAISKRADVEQAHILARLSADEKLVIRVIDGHDLRRNTSGFPAMVEHLANELDGATVDTIWGIRPEPGAPVERVVLALRPRRSP